MSQLVVIFYFIFCLSFSLFKAPFASLWYLISLLWGKSQVFFLSPCSQDMHQKFVSVTILKLVAFGFVCKVWCPWHQRFFMQRCLSFGVYLFEPLPSWNDGQKNTITEKLSREKNAERFFSFFVHVIAFFKKKIIYLFEQIIKQIQLALHVLLNHWINRQKIKRLFATEPCSYKKLMFAEANLIIEQRQQ